MKICKACNSVLESDVNFCPKCGASDFRIKCDSCGNVFDKGAYCPQCGVRVGRKERTCPQCGEIYYSNACPNCGYLPGRSAQQTENNQTTYNINFNGGAERVPRQEGSYRAAPVPKGKEKSKIVAILLCLFLGPIGAHKFYEGKTGMGLLYLFTGGLCGIGWIVDLLVLLTKSDPYYV